MARAASVTRRPCWLWLEIAQLDARAGILRKVETIAATRVRKLE
jgi:hypothetical protein